MTILRCANRTMIDRTRTKTLQRIEFSYQSQDIRLAGNSDEREAEESGLSGDVMHIGEDT